MNRIPRGHSDAIAKAMLHIPEGIRERLRGVDFLCGVDPVFAGLHQYRLSGDGRSYAETAHVAYSMHQSISERDRRQTTVVLPKPCPPWVITHELGHALHERIGFVHTPVPVNEYAKRDRWEAFAEAFRVWIGWKSSRDARVDPQTAALFARLAA